MTAFKQPEWVDKLGEIWSRKDTAGFYELEDLFRESLDKLEQEVVEDFVKEIDELEHDYLSGPGLSDSTSDGLKRLRGRVLAKLNKYE